MRVGVMTATIANTLVVGALALQVHAQDTSAQYSPTASAPWRSDKVVYVAGLADVKPNTSGSLSLTQNTIVFTNKEVEGVIPLDRITTVSIGDERVATGGYVGKAARLIPIYGIGSAMGAVTNKSIDLLTIEYLDQNDGYHGAVFEVPKTQAVVAQQQIEPRTVAFVVDDAIVMVENISRFLEEGSSPMEAAMKGAEQIGFTIITLTVSLIAVLIPLLFMGDIVGRLFREFAVTLSVTILISAVVSLTLTPMMAARILRHKPESEQSSFYRWTEDLFSRITLPMEEACPGYCSMRPQHCWWQQQRSS